MAGAIIPEAIVKKVCEMVKSGMEDAAIGAALNMPKHRVAHARLKGGIKRRHSAAEKSAAFDAEHDRVQITLTPPGQSTTTFYTTKMTAKLVLELLVGV